ncbi:MAG: G1 family glutamic endopeptidase [Roseiarcus sp.]
MKSTMSCPHGRALGVAIAGFLFSLPTSAQPLAPHAVPTNLYGVYAVTQPPAEFNPLTASSADLESWGYPPRPGSAEGPEAMARWSQAVSLPVKRVIPQLKRTEGVYHRRATGLKITNSNGSSFNATSSNWSGYALVPGTGAQPFYIIEGRWTVPTVKQAPGTCSGGWDYSSHWVGIGGFSDAFLLQAGSAANVYCDIGNSVPEYFPWLEWLPQSELVIYQNASTDTTFPFQPGDYLVVYVWATNFSGGVSTTGELLYEDITQGWSVALVFSAASVGGSEVTGKSAEWIVERTEVGGQLATLPDYTADPWWATIARDLGGTYYYPGAPGTASVYNITMLDNSNEPVSYVSLLGTYSAWFFPEGSAVQ